MAYRVKLTALAEADAYSAYEYIRELSPQSAEKWLRSLFLAVFTLDEMPSRCPLTAEASDIGQPLRQLVYGKRTGTYESFLIFKNTPKKVRAFACCASGMARETRSRQPTSSPRSSPRTETLAKT